MKERLAIIGANEAITILIEKAKQMGYETHVFAWQCGAPGEAAADFFYPISIDEKEKILEKCRELKVVGVCSITSDYAAPTVSYVAREMGLVCNPERTGIVARDKYEMRCALKDAGLYTPEFYRVEEDFSIEDFSEIQYPVIVKPTDRWSSKGVTRVNNIAELRAAVRYATAESFNHKAIIEGFMSGPEYSAECICFNGERHVLAFTQKQTTDYPHYIETGHVQPANLSREQQATIEKVIIRSLEALDIQNGAAHAEFRILDNGEIGIIEIGARMGGDCIGTDLTPISTGLDYIRMVIDVACGKAPCFERVYEPSSVGVRFIVDEDDMKVFNNFRETHAEKIIRYGELDDKFDRTVIDSSTRHGYYVFFQ